MKKIILGAVLIGSVSFAFAQSRADYDACVGNFRKFYNAKQYDSLYTLLSPRIQGLLPADKTAEMMGQLYTQKGEMLNYQFDKVEGGMNYYKVSFKSEKLKLIANLSKENKMEVFRFIPDNEETKVAKQGNSDVKVKVDGGELHGTLTMPTTSAKVPVVLLIAGSGPTDRNGNNTSGLKTNTYMMIADSLQTAGIACVRYDKRGVGESESVLKDEALITFDNMVDDAIAFLKMLKADKRFNSVTVIGHSEGSLIGIVATEKAGANKYISLAGAGESADKILVRQLSEQNPENGKRAGQALDSIRKGFQVSVSGEGMESLFRPSIQGYLRSWMKYDPQVEIKKLKVPVLIVQGRRDLQVRQEDAEMLKKGNPKAQLIYFDSMNHLMKDVSSDKSDNYASYQKPELPLSDGFMKLIIGHIKSKS